MGANVRVSFGAVLVGDEAPVSIGDGTVIRENVVLRSSRANPVLVGHHVLTVAQSALYGCTVSDRVFLATGTSKFHGAVVEEVQRCA